MLRPLFIAVGVSLAAGPVSAGHKKVPPKRTAKKASTASAPRKKAGTRRNQATHTGKSRLVGHLRSKSTSQLVAKTSRPPAIRGSAVYRADELRQLADSVIETAATVIRRYNATYKRVNERELAEALDLRPIIEGSGRKAPREALLDRIANAADATERTLQEAMEFVSGLVLSEHAAEIDARF